MRMHSTLCLMLLWLLSYLPVAAQQDRQLDREKPGERRIALVIGNGAYANVPRLRNPSSDARLVAATLTRLGFEVFTGTDKSQREMKQMIREFGAQLRSGRAVGLFYFAGHGVQAKGRNYLIPVDADIQTEADLEDTAVDLNYVLNTMDDAQNALNIAILDACRNNPFARSFRSTQDGLAQVVAPTGTLIAYATAPNSVAADGGGENSPYTEELARQIEKPGVLVETMFRRVTEQVSARTGGRQEPWYAANVKGDFYFVSGDKSPIVGFIGGAEPVVPPKGGTKITFTPLVTVRPYSIELRSCKMPALDVICELRVTNESSETREFTLSHNDYRLRRRGKDASKGITNEGNQYDLSESTIGSQNARSGSIFNRAVLAPNVAVRMVLTFKNVAESSTRFTLLRLAIYQESSNNPSLMQYADFKNILIEK